MSEIKAIKIADNQYIYVEVDDSVDDAALPKSSSPATQGGQSTTPDNFTDCSVVDDAIDALKSLQRNIETLANTVYDSFQTHQPEEWSLEINIGFKGKTSPIPVILSGEASGAIKVTAKWKKTP
jgi:hypothetical protein